MPCHCSHKCCKAEEGAVHELNTRVPTRERCPPHPQIALAHGQLNTPVLLPVLQRDSSAPWLPLPTPTPITAAGQELAQERGVPAFVSVLRPPSGLDIAVWAKMFVAYARYHRKLGFAAVIIYARDSMVEALADAPMLKRALHNREVFLVRWDDVAPFPADPDQLYDQVLVNFVQLTEWLASSNHFQCLTFACTF
jgi:hypothetical protein